MGDKTPIAVHVVIGLRLNDFAEGIDFIQPVANGQIERKEDIITQPHHPGADHTDQHGQTSEDQA